MLQGNVTICDHGLTGENCNHWPLPDSSRPIWTSEILCMQIDALETPEATIYKWVKWDTATRLGQAWVMSIYMYLCHPTNGPAMENFLRDPFACSKLTRTITTTASNSAVVRHYAKQVWTSVSWHPKARIMCLSDQIERQNPANFVLKACSLILYK